MREVELYKDQKVYKINLFGLTREMPLVKVDDGIWIASDAELVLGDTEFIEKAAVNIAKLIQPYNPEVLVTPEAKSIAFAYEVSKQLGHRRFVIARKSVKAYMKDYLIETVKSITTKGEQKLVLTKESAEYIKGKRVCIIDDVVSTGGTILALKALVKKAGGKIVCEAAIWKEGPWYRGSNLIFVDILPIFVSEDRVKEFEENIERKIGERWR